MRVVAMMRCSARSWRRIIAFMKASLVARAVVLLSIASSLACAGTSAGADHMIGAADVLGQAALRSHPTS
jgi:hypothetical protein